MVEVCVLLQWGCKLLGPCFAMLQNNMVVSSSMVDIQEDILVIANMTTILSKNVGNQQQREAMPHPRRTQTSRYNIVLLVNVLIVIRF
jgi:hypothetical protein